MKPLGNAVISTSASQTLHTKDVEDISEVQNIIFSCKKSKDMCNLGSNICA